MDRTLTILAIGLVLYILTCLKQFWKLTKAERMETGGQAPGIVHKAPPHREPTHDEVLPQA